MTAEVTALVGNLRDAVGQLFTYPFMTHAIWASTIIAIVAGAMGWFMVLRRETFAGHSLAVVGFPGAAAAALVGAPVQIGYLVFCVAAAAVMGGRPRFARRGRGVSSSTVGTVQAAALALGVLFTVHYGGFLGGVDALLFGTFLGVTSSDVVVLGGVGLVVLVALGVIARPLLFASVDRPAAEAVGVPTGWVEPAFLVLLGATVAEVSTITGSLLVFAILVMPASTAQRLTARPGLGVALSILCALATTWAGLVAAYYSPWPVGFFLTTIAFGAYLAATAYAAAARRLGRRRPIGAPA